MSTCDSGFCVSGQRGHRIYEYYAFAESVRRNSINGEYPEAVGIGWVSIDHLNRRPSPLPNTDVRRAGKLDLPASAFDDNVRQCLGYARPVGTVSTQ